MIVNRVSPADGRLTSTSQEKLKLSRWAEDWAKRHGKVWCEERVRNNAERDRQRAVQAENEPARPVFEAMREATTGFDQNQRATEAAADLKAD